MSEPTPPPPLSGEELLASYNEQGVPSHKELFEFLKEFLTRRANLPVEPVNWAPEGLADLPLEKSILFSEPFQGLLVIRSNRNFGRFLEEAFHADKDTAAQGDVFIELTVLIWHYFNKQFWKLDSRKITPSIIRSSLPIQWPDRNPRSACMAFVKGCPFEVRLWNKLTETEISRWKTKP